MLSVNKLEIRRGDPCITMTIWNDSESSGDIKSTDVELAQSDVFLYITIWRISANEEMEHFRILTMNLIKTK